jgi:hypothetical protein
VSALAVGDVHQAPVAETFTVRQDLSQDQHVEGMPLGTVGGIRIRRTFPVDATYDLKVRFFRTNFGNLRGLEHPHQVELAVMAGACAWSRSAATMISGRRSLRPPRRPTQSTRAWRCGCR